MKGIITLEDVIEKLIQVVVPGRQSSAIFVACSAKENIEDESDRVERTATMRSDAPKRSFRDLGRFAEPFHEVSDLR